MTVAFRYHRLRIRFGRRLGRLFGSDLLRKNGVYFGLYYWITNEMMVIGLTYCLYYDYFGKELLANIVDKITPSFWKIDVHHIGEHNWSIAGVELSPKLMADFAVSSLVMSAFTPLQLPVCAATYPWLRRRMTRLLGRN